MAESNEVTEGFICPICMKDLGTLADLQSHFGEVHSVISSDEDPATVHNIKGMLGKAKRKIMGKPDDGAQAITWERSEQLQTTIAGKDLYFSYWEPQEIGRCRSLTREFRDRRSQTIDDGIIEINKLLIRMEKILKVSGDAKDSRLSGSSSKKAKERSLVPWISDSEAKLCFGCKKSFTVARRKHHCRLCGQVICGKCSEFLPLTFAATLCKMQNEVKEIAVDPDQSETNEQNGFRICPTCDETILRHYENKMEKQTKIPLVQLYERMTVLMADADLLLPDFNKMAESLSFGDNRYGYEEVVKTRRKLLKIYETLELLCKKVVALGSKSTEDGQDKTTNPGIQSQKLRRGIHAFVTDYLQRTMLTLKPIPSQNEFATLQVERSRLLSKRAEREKAQQEKVMKERAKMHKEVLRQERDSRDSSPEVRRKQLGGNHEMRNSFHPHDTGPLLEQIHNVKEFLRKAKESGRYEEVGALERNLNELQTEYNKRTKR